jgi:Spy/CpxP family protein refolding chaperone
MKSQLLIATLLLLTSLAVAPAATAAPIAGPADSSGHCFGVYDHARRICYGVDFTDCQRAIPYCPL